MRKFLLALLLFIFVIVVWILAKAGIFANQPIKALTTTLEVAKEENKDERYSIDVKYPKISGVSSIKIQEDINDRIKSLVDQSIGEFKSGVRGLDVSFVSPEFTSNFTVRYKVVQATNKLVSINFTISKYWAGAAHPNSVAAVFNYDVDRKKELELYDIFKKNSNYVKVLSDISTVTLLKNVVVDSQENNQDASFLTDWIKKGAGPEQQNFKNFALSKHSLIIIFDPYQVAPYSAGFKRVEIPYQKLTEIFALKTRSGGSL